MANERLRIHDHDRVWAQDAVGRWWIDLQIGSRKQGAVQDAAVPELLDASFLQIEQGVEHRLAGMQQVAAIPVVEIILEIGIRQAVEQGPDPLGFYSSPPRRGPKFRARPCVH